MRARRVGRSGLEVSVLGLGTMGWGESTDAFEARDMLTQFVDAGGTFIDTAASYGGGSAEEMLGSLLADKALRDRVVVASKAGLEGRTRPRDASRGALLASLDASLRRLQTDHLDLWQVHIWDEHTPLEETAEALATAVQSGRVRYVGVSNYTGWQLVWIQQLTAAGVPVVSNQVEYSLVNRMPEHELVDAAAAMEVSLLAWSALGRGVLTGKYRYSRPADSRARDTGAWRSFVDPYLTDEAGSVVEAVAKAAEGLELSVSHVALAWLLARPQVAAAIVGPRTADQLAGLLGAPAAGLPQAIIDALDDVSEVEA